jgi:hypothetical protein
MLSNIFGAKNGPMLTKSVLKQLYKYIKMLKCVEEGFKGDRVHSHDRFFFVDGSPDLLGEDVEFGAPRGDFGATARLH